MRSCREVERGRQVQVVELLEVLPQGRVDLGLGRLGLEQVAVANAALLGQRRRAAAAAATRSAPRVRPSGRASGGTRRPAGAAPGRTPGGRAAPATMHRIERRRSRRAPPPSGSTEPSDTGRPDRTLSATLVVPREQLLRADVPCVQQQRHRRLGEVQRLRAGSEPDESVATRQVEQPVAQRGEDGVGGRRSGIAVGDDLLEVEVDRLVAVRLEALDQRVAGPARAGSGRARPSVPRRRPRPGAGRARSRTGSSGSARASSMSSVEGEVQARGKRDQQHAQAGDVG